MGNISNGIIDTWAKQAMDDMENKSWRDIDTNSLLLIVYAVQKAAFVKLAKQVAKPLWGLLVAAFMAIAWAIAKSLLGI